MMIFVRPLLPLLLLLPVIVGRLSGPGADPIATNDPSGLPDLKTVLWEKPRGKVTMQEMMDVSRGGITDVLIKKKVR